MQGFQQCLAVKKCFHCVVPPPKLPNSLSCACLHVFMCVFCVCVHICARDWGGQRAMLVSFLVTWDHDVFALPVLGVAVPGYFTGL